MVTVTKFPSSQNAPSYFMPKAQPVKSLGLTVQLFENYTSLRILLSALGMSAIILAAFPLFAIATLFLDFIPMVIR